MLNDEIDIPQSMMPRNEITIYVAGDSIFESKPIYSIGVWDPATSHVNHGSDF